MFSESTGREMRGVRQQKSIHWTEINRVLFQEMMQAAGLNPRHRRVMKGLLGYDGPRKSQSRLAADLDVSKQRIAQIISALEKKPLPAAWLDRFRSEERRVGKE